MRFTAFIPLRGGSKSIPRKNIKLLAGKPLCWWSINSALQSKIFDKIVVSTEDPEIKSVVERLFGKQVIVDTRPNHLAQDTTSTEAVVLEYLEREETDVITLIQATSPLTSAQDFLKAKEKYLEGNLDSLLTGVEFKRFTWTHDGNPINYDPANRPRRQEFKGQVLENGAFYMTNASLFLENNNRIAGKVGIHLMNEDTAFEIDEPSDWPIVEGLLRSRVSNSLELGKIKALVLDVDGTLTDGGMYYSENGEALKKFNTKDAKGIEMFRKSGLKVCIITAEDSPRVHSRMKKISITSENYFFGIKDKLPVLKEWANKNDLKLSEIAYGGDDLGDLDCMQAVGYPFCPADAIQRIKDISNYICEQKAGQGSVREFIELVLDGKHQYE